MEVRARPLVHGSVTFTLEPADGGRSTTVTVEEHPVGLHRVLTPVLTPLAAARNRTSLEKDRKSVVWGKSVSVRVDLGGRRIIKQKPPPKTPTTPQHPTTHHHNAPP